VEFINDERRDAFVSALLAERDAYKAKGDETNVKAVTAELQRLGVEAKTKTTRAEKRPVKDSPAKETR
jgi:hypothetical protein